ncbi:unnamed protein product [Malus baccata var. baccata]
MWSNQWLIKYHCIYAFVDFCYVNEGIQRIEASRSEFNTVGLHNPTIGLFLGRSSFRFLAHVIQNSVGANLVVDVWSLGCIVLDMATTKTTLEPLISPFGFMYNRRSLYSSFHFFWKNSLSGKFVHPSGVEHYFSDGINALRNCYGDKQLFTPFVCECMHCVQCYLGRWLFEVCSFIEILGLRGHAKESILLATEEYTSHNSNVMMCGML